MKQLRLPIFPSKIKYYNLRIVPSDKVLNEVIAVKKQFESVFGKQPLSRSKPHITLATFKMNSKNEKLLTEVLDQLSRHRRFKLILNGYGVFERSRTLFLDVSNNESLVLLHRDLKLLYHQHLKEKVKMFTVLSKPHITISKTAGKKMLYKSLQHFIKNEYRQEIMVNHLILLSRTKYKTWDWEHRIELAESDIS